MNVALDFSGRVETVQKPLETVGHTITSIQAADVLITDSLRKNPLLRVQTDIPIYYRPRSDVLKLYRRYKLGYLRGRGNALVALRFVDGVIAPDPLVAAKLRQVSAAPVRTIPLPKDVRDYPIEADATPLTQLLTLTNFDYRRKIDPLVSWCDPVNEWCEENNAIWCVAGDGEYTGRFCSQIAEYDNILYVGYVDPLDWLAESSVLLHPSELDIQYPNAILEGMASGLPVITNDYAPFTEGRTATAYSNDDLKQLLTHYHDHVDETGREYVAQKHSPETIGETYSQVIA